MNIVTGVWAVAVIVAVLSEFDVVPHAVGNLCWFIGAGAVVVSYVAPLLRGKKDVNCGASRNQIPISSCPQPPYSTTYTINNGHYLMATVGGNPRGYLNPGAQVEVFGQIAYDVHGAREIQIRVISNPIVHPEAPSFDAFPGDTGWALADYVGYQ